MQSVHAQVRHVEWVYAYTRTKCSVGHTLQRINVGNGGSGDRCFKMRHSSSPKQRSLITRKFFCFLLASTTLGRTMGEMSVGCAIVLVFAIVLDA